MLQECNIIGRLHVFSITCGIKSSNTPIHRVEVIVIATQVSTFWMIYFCFYKVLYAGVPWPIHNWAIDRAMFSCFKIINITTQGSRLHSQFELIFLPWVCIWCIITAPSTSHRFHLSNKRCTYWIEALIGWSTTARVSDLYTDQILHRLCCVMPHDKCIMWAGSCDLNKY